MRNLSKVSSCALTALLVLSTFLIIAPAHAATTMDLIDAADGDSSFHYTTAEKNVGDLIYINVSVSEVTNLFSWQIKVSWDPTLLEGNAVNLPSDHVFAGQPFLPAGPDFSVPGTVVYACTLLSGGTPFTGTGRLCVIVLKIIQEVTMLNPMVQCNIEFVNVGADTFMLNDIGGDIAFTATGGHYQYNWLVPSTTPGFYIAPSTIKPLKMGDTFDVNVYVENVDPNWEIIAFQFSIMWNREHIAPVDPYYAPGTFMESFSYYTPPENGVLYAAAIDCHDRFLPLTPIPDNWNYSTIGVLLLPDPAMGDTYHPPFPSGGGLLATLKFEAIHETISPAEDWITIEFITFDDDILVLNRYGMDVGFDHATLANYRCPQKILGLSIDLYTQYTAPYGGQGANQPSDMFGPQQQVELFALVTYNEYPVQQKLVGFEIHHGDYIFWREGTTDENGLAHVSFRLPWPCVDPVGEIFGKWIVTATVEVAEQVVNDTVGFWVWWKVFVISNEPKETEYEQRKTGGDDLTFTNTYATYSMQLLQVLFTETVYDELGFFIGSDDLQEEVGWGEYKYYDYLACESPPLATYPPWDVTIPLPTNAVVGKGIVFTNAFDMPPWVGGVPYCPEVCNTIDFYIVKPS